MYETLNPIIFRKNIYVFYNFRDIKKKGRNHHIELLILKLPEMSSKLLTKLKKKIVYIRYFSNYQAQKAEKHLKGKKYSLRTDSIESQ